MKHKPFSKVVGLVSLVCPLVFAGGCSKSEMKSLDKKEELLTEKQSSKRDLKSISITFPKNGESVHILKPRVLDYIDAMHEQAKQIENDYLLHDFYAWDKEYSPSDHKHGTEFSNETDKVRISDFTAGLNEEKSKKVSLVFDSLGFAQGTDYLVKVSKNADLSEAKEIHTTNSYATIDNLFAGTTYYWQVSAGGVSSEIESFTTDEGFRMISAGAVSNIRDMGGRPVSGGKHIKQGLIYRGGELVRENYVPTDSSSTHYQSLYEDNLPILQDELGIKYEIDFRGDAESGNITESPLKDENHQDIDYLRIPNMSGYDYVFKMNSTMNEKVKTMFLAFKDALNKPVYFHCWGGADRTGTAGFLLGALLGMSFTDLVIDFELTSFSNNYRPHQINDANKIYRFPHLIGAIYTLTTKADSSKTYYEADKPLSQIVEEILIDRFGLTSQDISEIRANLLED